MATRCHNVPNLNILRNSDEICPDGSIDRNDYVIRGGDRDAVCACEVVAGGFDLDDDELKLFDCWAEEEIDISGTPITYYAIDFDGTIRDPLYDEPIALAFKKFDIKALISYPESTPEAREEGFKIEFRGQATLARVTIEKECMPVPQEGDILQIWDIPFYRDWGQARATNVPNSGYYFDVTAVSETDHIFDNPAFLYFRLDLKRNTTFTPERKLFGDVEPPQPSLIDDVP